MYVSSWLESAASPRHICMLFSHSTLSPLLPCCFPNMEATPVLSFNVSKFNQVWNQWSTFDRDVPLWAWRAWRIRHFGCEVTAESSTLLHESLMRNGSKKLLVPALVLDKTLGQRFLRELGWRMSRQWGKPAGLLWSIAQISFLFFFQHDGERVAEAAESLMSSSCCSS